MKKIHLLFSLGACPRIENILQKIWIWPDFSLILVKYAYILLKLVKNLTQTSFPSLRFLFSDKLLIITIAVTLNTKAIDFVVDVNDDVFLSGDINPGDGLCQTPFTLECSLRAAIVETNALPGSHRIILSNTNYVLNQPLLITNSDVQIIGTGMNQTTIDGNMNDQIFNMFESNVTVKELSLINGKATVANGAGGAIYANGGSLPTASLTIERVKFRNNSANTGGALRTLDITVNINTSIFENNSLEDLGISSLYGSAISARRSNMNIYDSSIYLNSNGSNTIYSTKGNIFMQNTTVSANSSIGLRTENSTSRINFSTFNNNPTNFSRFSFDGSQQMYIGHSIIQNATTLNCGSIDKPISLGHNVSDDVSCELIDSTDLESTDAQLAGLTDNGGLALTHEPALTSPAIDNVPIVDCLEIDGSTSLSHDQRGLTRPFGSACDSGSIEYMSALIFENGFE